MQPIATVAVSVLLSAAAATATAFAVRGNEASPDAQALPQLQRVVEELRASQQAMQQKLDALAAAPAPATASGPALDRKEAGIPVAQLAAAVEAYLQKRGSGTAAPAAADASTPTFDMDTEFAELVGKDFWSNPAAWRKAFAAGRMDEVIAKFEALAAANPKDTKVQMDLARAYMAYVQLDQSKWQNSMKADGVFDKVLALDDKHWEARFTKAVSYTFYPDFLGKKKDAISHFETLVKQQDQMPAQPYEAQTYLYLGNLLEARDPARAKEMWAKGAARHPDSQELAKKLAGQ